MNKHITLIMLVGAMSGCTIWKHQTRLAGEGEMESALLQTSNR